jgi:uncharacterized membrane protein YqiK
MINDDNGSLSIESIFDTLLRMGLVMQMTVLTVTIMLTIVVVFLINVALGAWFKLAGFSTGPAAIFGYMVGQGESSAGTDARIVNGTQKAFLGWLKWNP